MHLSAGQSRAIAIIGDRRAELMPTVPLFAKADLSAVDARSLGGIVAPAGTPEDFVRPVNSAVQRALQIEPVQERITEMGFHGAGGSPGEFEAYIHKEVAKWGSLIKRAGIPTE